MKIIIHHVSFREKEREREREREKQEDEQRFVGGVYNKIYAVYTYFVFNFIPCIIRSYHKKSFFLYGVSKRNCA